MKALDKLPAKVFRQVVLKILSLQQTPIPHDCKRIGPGYRVDSGEYRILYFFEPKEDLVRVVLVGKRNDDEVYQQFTRRFGS
ncbi:MAG: type II toxin-antitoxin system RelE/ParE family toxin [Chloroflexota bacterium]